VLVLLSALFSGLTLGVLGLDLNELEIIKAAGDPEQRKAAERLLPVRRQGNLLLCTLVLGNVAVTSLSSVLLSTLTSGLVGFAISTVLITVFGEIIPQAVCARYALAIGARSVPVVRLFVFLFFPLTKPLALILDYALGDEVGMHFTRAEFLKLVALQVGSNLFHASEASIISGALTFRAKLVREVATGLDRMFAVCATDTLDAALLRAIFESGYSRVPVWDEARVAVVGVLIVKDLLLVTPEQQRQPVISAVHSFGRDAVNVIDDAQTLEEAIKMFVATRSHFAVVRTVDVPADGTDPTYRVAGCITMEDVLEEIIGLDLHDAAARGGAHHARGRRAAGGAGGDASPRARLSPRAPEAPPPTALSITDACATAAQRT